MTYYNIRCYATLHYAMLCNVMFWYNLRTVLYWLHSPPRRRAMLSSSRNNLYHICMYVCVHIYIYISSSSSYYLYFILDYIQYTLLVVAQNALDGSLRRALIARSLVITLILIIHKNTNILMIITLLLIMIITPSMIW